MSITYESIPSTLRVPFVAVEFSASQAQQGPALLAYRALIIGQKTSAGSAAANSLHRVTSPEQVITLAGRGSMLHRMAIAWFASNRATEVWVGVLADAGAGVAAAASFSIGEAAQTAPGTITLRLGGVPVLVPVAVGDDEDAIAAAIADAINDNADLPVTAAATDEVVSVTFRHKGLVGNEYRIRVESVPTGVALGSVGVLGDDTAGTTNPPLTDLIAAMGDTWFQVIAHPYTDSASLTAIDVEMASRNGPMRMIDGVAITSAAGTFSALTTLGGGRNSPHHVIVAQDGDKPLTPSMEFAAEVAALVAFYGNQDPARPFQTLAMRHALPQDLADRFTFEERNLLLFDGVATTLVGPGDVVQLERLITTYQQNAAGADDTAYLDVTTMLTLLYLRYSFRTRVKTRYPRHKLANDGVRVGPGQPVITPKLGKAEAINWFREMEELGLVENFDQFKRDLVVARDNTDPNRLNFLLPPDLINQLIVTAASIQFRL